MKKLLMCLLALAIGHVGFSDDLAWKDIESQQTPIGAGFSMTGTYGSFDSWGQKSLVATGTYGTGACPFVSRYVDVWTSESMSLDLMAPGFLLLFR